MRLRLVVFLEQFLRIANKTDTIYWKNHGTFVKGAFPFTRPLMQNDTIFDIASLNKVTGTLGVI